MRKLKKIDFFDNEYISASKKDISSFVSLHSHEFYEIELILSGSGTYSIDGQDYVIEPGCLFFMTPMNMHSVDINNATIYNLMFSGEICNPAYFSSLSSKSPLILKVEHTSDVFYRALFDELIQNYNDKMYCQTLLDTIISKLDHEADNYAKHTHLSYIQRAELYILNNFKNEITLGSAAEHVGLTPTYFSKLFAEEMNQTFKKYVNNMRFEYAKKLLLFSDLTVMQICSECGFQDYPNFVRRFKQHTGMYPLEYRNSNK